MEKTIPLSIPNFEGNEERYVTDAIRQGWVSVGGAYITTLEQNLAKYPHVEDTVACQSGTAALHLSLIEAGVGCEDVVLVPTLTFIATVNPVRYVNATPVFMDCDDSLCMDPKKLRRFCETCCEEKDGVLYYREHPVKALIVVHVFGNLADMEEIMKIAKQYHIVVIEDATEALGSYFTDGEYAGQYAGTIGDFGAYSFNGNKIITTGGGGAAVSKVPKINAHMRYLSTQAKDDAQFYIHDAVGYNYRMTNVQAAIGVAQLEELDMFIERKRKHYASYQAGFADFRNAELLPFRENTHANMWFYSLKINREKVKMSMRELVEALGKRGIQTRTVWGLIHEQKPYRDFDAVFIERAKEYSDCILNIPCSTQITEEEIRFVVDSIRDIIE